MLAVAVETACEEMLAEVLSDRYATPPFFAELPSICPPQILKEVFSVKYKAPPNSAAVFEFSVSTSKFKLNLFAPDVSVLFKYIAPPLPVFAVLELKLVP